jgi:hypothetical protein
MSTLFSWPSWLKVLGRKSPVATVGKRPVTRKRQQDFADYGTAFGLDMSLSSEAQVQSQTESAAPIMSAKALKSEAHAARKSAAVAR